MKQKKRPSVLRIVQRKKNQKPKTRNAVKDEEEMNVVDINRRPQRERERKRCNFRVLAIFEPKSGISLIFSTVQKR